jgi:hypothetical protein
MSKKRIFCTAMILMFLLSALPIIFVQADGGTETVVYVDPKNITGLVPPQKFDISVKIANVTNLYGLDIKLKWDPLILEYVSHSVKIPVETYPEGVLHKPVLSVKDDVNSTAGTYGLAYASMLPAPSFNGSGVAFTMRFKVKGYGRCVLEITAKLPDKDGFPISHEVQHGYFVNFTPPPAKIGIMPPRIIDSGLVPCTNFTINVKLEEVYDLDMFEFWIAYNTSVLDVADIVLDPLFPPSQQETLIMEEEGKTKVKGWLSPSPPFTGNIMLANVTFHATSIGESVLDLFNVTLIDKFGENISYREPTDGFFSNILMAKLYVDPKELIDPSLRPGDRVVFRIKMEDAYDIYGYEFSLQYNQEVITCLGAVINPVSNETNFNTEISIIDVLGQLRINVTYHPPAEPVTVGPPTTIAEIYFQVKSYGSSILHLYDTRIVNQYGDPLIHETEDGFFATIIRDVAILEITASPIKVYPGKIVTITVVAANLGDISETFNVTIYHDDIEIGKQTVINLPSKQNYTLTFYWNTTGLLPGTNSSLKAEASQLPSEIDTLNNVLVQGYVFIKMIGDVNGDRIIDIYDVIAVSTAYDATPGDPNWNPEADVAPPFGIIDLFDIVTVTAKYGQTY